MLFILLSSLFTTVESEETYCLRFTSIYFATYLRPHVRQPKHIKLQIHTKHQVTKSNQLDLELKQKLINKLTKYGNFRI